MAKYRKRNIFGLLSLYCVMAFFSLIIRQNLLPTPAAAMGLQVFGLVDIINVIQNPEIVLELLPGLFGTFINFIIEMPLYQLTFRTVGLMYQRGDGGWKGSFLYLLIYAINIGFLTACAAIGPVGWAIFLVIIGYLGLLISLGFAYFFLFKRKNSYTPTTYP